MATYKGGTGHEDLASFMAAGQRQSQKDRSREMDFVCALDQSPLWPQHSSVCCSHAQPMPPPSMGSTSSATAFQIQGTTNSLPPWPPVGLRPRCGESAVDRDGAPPSVETPACGERIAACLSMPNAGRRDEPRRYRTARTPGIDRTSALIVQLSPSATLNTMMAFDVAGACRAGRGQ